MNEYELTYIRKSSLDQDRVDRIEARLKRAFEKCGGEILRSQDLGEKVLAYEIQKEARGHYVQMNFLGNGALVDELEREFRLAPEVLRFLTVRLNRNVDPETKKKEYAEKKSSRAAGPHGEVSGQAAAEQS